MKAQAFSLDVIVSILIICLLLISVFYVVNVLISEAHEREERRSNVNQALLSLKVLLEDNNLGIVDDRNVINSSKLQYFLENCNNTTFITRIGITKNFYFRISDEFYAPLYECGQLVPEREKRLSHFTRISLLKNGSEERIVKVSMVIWG